MAGYSVFRHAGTEVDECFIVEDTFCRLIINVQPEQKLNKDLLPIVLPSSPAIANTFVVRSCNINQNLLRQISYLKIYVIYFCMFLLIHTKTF